MANPPSQQGEIGEFYRITTTGIIRCDGVHDHFVLPHASLRQALAEPIPTYGSGSAKLWQPRSPAMAAGLTDHIWTLKEVLMFRVPPWPQPQTV